MINVVAKIRKSTRERRSCLPFEAESCINNFSPVSRRKSIAPGPKINLNKSLSFMTPKTPLVLSQEPKTPAPSTAICNEPTPKTTYCNPIMAKIQKDLNSPSAGARIRANKALKSPNFRKQIYGQFDVPHERQDIITAEERKSLKPKTMKEIFEKCIIYVEVRTGDDNRSAGIKNRLLRDGIVVNEKLYKDTTHVIFKDGLLSTFKNALKLGIPVTTILWIESCASQKRLVDPEKFKISNLDRYERPELYKRLRRQKSMQPEVSTMVVRHSVKALTQDEPLDRFDDKTIMECAEQEADSAGMELTLQNEQTFCEETDAMEIEPADDPAGLDKWKRNFRRFTTFTPNPMEQTGLVTKSAVASRRRTIFTSQLSKNSDVSSPDWNGFSANSSNTVVFNSTNKISKSSRRSVFDISMNIFELNCKAVGEKRQESTLSETKINSPMYPKSHETQTPAKAMMPIVRKRKLFNNEDLDGIEECKENQNESIKNIVKKPKSAVSTFNTPQLNTKPKPKIDRRQTLAYFKPAKSKELAPLKTKTPVKSIATPKIIVCTNMSSGDKMIFQAAINKLGGKVETEVTSKTTHVVTPNDDRTMNVLRGVIQACVIVNVNWIHDSLAQNKWLETSIYQRDICDSNRVYERSVLGTKNYKNTTFAHRGFFYLNKDKIDNVKKVEYLKEIIALCGGSITDAMSEAKIIVSDEPMIRDNEQQVVVVPTYIFDSAMSGKCLEATRYNPKLAKA